MGVAGSRELLLSEMTAQSALGGEPTHIATCPWDTRRHVIELIQLHYSGSHLIVDNDPALATGLCLPGAGVSLPGDEHPLAPGLHHLQGPGVEPVLPPGLHQHPIPVVHQVPRHLALLTELDPPPKVAG